MHPWDGEERRHTPPLICDEAVIERIAESAVKKAFKHVGIDLEEEESGEALKGLVSLVTVARRTTRAATKEFAKLLGQLLALAVLTYLAMKLGFGNLLDSLKHLIGSGS
jgi:hypothetical protein